MESTASYNLNLDPPKQNVFVTQLHDREDEYEAPETRQLHPVVTESANKLIETGINTLQKTLLLKKQVEVEKIDEELLLKRKEFEERMERCNDRRTEVEYKQQQMREKIAKFDKFIKDSESKRRRAVQKYQTEVRLKEQKFQELEKLYEELEALQERHAYLKDKVRRYQIYEEYLNQVIEILPPHYLQVNDSQLNALMMRHRTLSDTNKTLIENLSSMVDQVEEQKQKLNEMRQEQANRKFSSNSKLSILKKNQDKKEFQNDQQEQAFSTDKVKLRQQRTEFGIIDMAIKNLAEKCLRPHDPPLTDLSLEDKLNLIKTFVLEKSEVVKLVHKEAAKQKSSVH